MTITVHIHNDEVEGATVVTAIMDALATVNVLPSMIEVEK